MGCSASTGENATGVALDAVPAREKKAEAEAKVAAAKGGGGAG
eukprot:CAMPEP_0167821902 /NCGR_PEP_ID=MMETSP0112_2-20121227/7108_1 /TAXON_ID=91324 /ORGANISM="Lotharella globosa, Strain CCCM811" /LENGTH=42 /DNA_ID= /DNA_START= /DNA_END= /DNA_ORIENTATION=